MKQNKRVLLTIVVIAVLAVGSVLAFYHPPTGKKTPASVDTSAAVATTAVSITNYMFSPISIKVKTGETVTWTNQDAVHHNVVADTVSADAPNGPLIGQKETYSFTFKKAGTYTIHCAPHPFMHGTIVVTD